MKVKNTKPNIAGIGLPNRGEIRLMPGINFVPDRLWELAKAQKLGVKDPRTGKKTQVGVVDALLADGTLEIVHPGKPGEEPTDGTPSLKGHETGEAVRLARETFDLQALHRLLESEDRPEVKAALQGQIDEINRPPDEEEKKARESGEGPDTSPRLEPDPDDESGEDRVVMPKPATHISPSHKLPPPTKKGGR